MPPSSQVFDLVLWSWFMGVVVAMFVVLVITMLLEMDVVIMIITRIQTVRFEQADVGDEYDDKTVVTA